VKFANLLLQKLQLCYAEVAIVPQIEVDVVCIVNKLQLPSTEFATVGKGVGYFFRRA
jgi:hypothetical protein